MPKAKLWKKCFESFSLTFAFLGANKKGVVFVKNHPCTKTSVSKGVLVVLDDSVIKHKSGPTKSSPVKLEDYSLSFSGCRYFHRCLCLMTVSSSTKNQVLAGLDFVLLGHPTKRVDL